MNRGLSRFAFSGLTPHTSPPDSFSKVCAHIQAANRGQRQADSWSKADPCLEKRKAVYYERANGQWTHKGRLSTSILAREKEQV
jgi:hypothetical protein